MEELKNEQNVEKEIEQVTEEEIHLDRTTEWWESVRGMKNEIDALAVDDETRKRIYYSIAAHVVRAEHDAYISGFIDGADLIEKRHAVAQTETDE